MTMTVVQQNNVETERNGSFIVTYTGQRFWPLDPRQEEIHIEDIAHALAHCCRYTGHVAEFYSIAEHSVRASYQVWSGYEFDALMHDASEAYLIDVPRPLKALPAFQEYLEIEDSLMYMIAEHFNFNWPMSAEVKEVDDYMLLGEWKSLMPLNDDLTGPFFDAVRSYEGPEIETWSAKEAEQKFLERFEQLQRG